MKCKNLHIESYSGVTHCVDCVALLLEHCSTTTFGAQSSLLVKCFFEYKNDFPP